MSYQTLQMPRAAPIKMWIQGVPVEQAAKQQLINAARMPFIFKHLAVMPDVHVGKGSTIGSVIPTKGAIIPAAVGVDIGCGMMAVRTSLMADDLPDNLLAIRSAIERAVPHGRTLGKGKRDVGAWQKTPTQVDAAWKMLQPDFQLLVEKYPRLAKTNNHHHLGTLGTGNHFVELCLDELNRVWVMLHSGSRGVGNAIGTHFIQLAKQDMQQHLGHLPDQDLAYFSEGSRYYEDYLVAVEWAQRYAQVNREVMMNHTLAALAQVLNQPFTSVQEAVNCHHNYVQQETHFAEQILVTRKGAVSAQKGQLGIIPGSMGAKSFIVRGLGNAESFCSCSHGAGRVMSRTQAKKLVSLAQHQQATAHVECRKDLGVLDETPAAYKDIDAVMAAQADLVEIVHTLRQIVCVKG